MISKKIFIILILLAGLAGISFWSSAQRNEDARFTDTEAGFNAEDQTDEEIYVPETIVLPEVPGRPFAGWGSYWRSMTKAERKYYDNFTAPSGPPKVGIQSGHWRVDEVPDELEGLKRSGAGAVGGGTTEAIIVLKIAQKVKDLLETEGIVVDLIPATIPPNYFADAFVSIHADGSTNTSVSGFKISGPRRDFSGRADLLVQSLYESYGEITSLGQDSNVTRRMSSYYAFNFRRYENALHPYTPAVIVETGFLTNAEDRKIIVSSPDLVAEGIAQGILDFLSKK